MLWPAVLVASGCCGCAACSGRGSARRRGSSCSRRSCASGRGSCRRSVPFVLPVPPVPVLPVPPCYPCLLFPFQSFPFRSFRFRPRRLRAPVVVVPPAPVVVPDPPIPLSVLKLTLCPWLNRVYVKAAAYRRVERGPRLGKPAPAPAAGRPWKARADCYCWQAR